MESRCTKRKRRTCWNRESQHVLLNLWAQYIGVLRVARKNGHIMSKMAADMGQLGHSYNAAEVKSKIHNLTNQYRDEKKKMASSGARTSDWNIFDRVHAILGEGGLDETTSEYADDNFDDHSISKSEELENHHDEISEEEDEDDEPHSVSKSEELENHHAEISKDEDHLQSVTKFEVLVDHHTEMSEEENCDDSIEETPDDSASTSGQNKDLATLNRNVVKVIEKLDIMNEQNLMAQKQMIKLEKERNELLRDLLRTFKNNSSEAQHRFGQKKSKLCQTDPLDGDKMYEMLGRNVDPLTDCNILSSKNDMELFPCKVKNIRQQEHIKDSKFMMPTNPESTKSCDTKTSTPDVDKSNNEKLALELEILREQHKEYLLTKGMEREFLAEKCELELEELRLNMERKKKDFVLQMLFK